MTTGEKLVQMSKLSSGSAINHLMNISWGGGVNAPCITEIEIVNCSAVGVHDGQMTINASGGTLPYTYALNDGEYQISNIFFNLTDGNYTLHVKDVSGYTDTISGIRLSASLSTLPFISEISIIDASSKITADGSIRIKAVSGTPPYTYALDDGEYQSSDIFMGLRYGVYSVKVKDSTDTISVLSGIKIGVPTTTVSGTGGGAAGGRNLDTRRRIPKIQVKNVKLTEQEPENKENEIKVKVVV